MENVHPTISAIIQSQLGITEKPKTKKVQVQQLKQGDVLQSGQIVTASPVAGLNTPRGKMELGIDGFLKVWGKYTIIVIKDQSI
jgi:hypothetical protein